MYKSSGDYGAKEPEDVWEDSSEILVYHRKSIVA